MVRLIFVKGSDLSSTRPYVQMRNTERLVLHLQTCLNQTLVFWQLKWNLTEVRKLEDVKKKKKNKFNLVSFDCMCCAAAVVLLLLSTKLYQHFWFRSSTGLLSHLLNLYTRLNSYNTGTINGPLVKNPCIWVTEVTRRQSYKRNLVLKMSKLVLRWIPLRRVNPI